jgi:acetate kinase
MKILVLNCGSSSVKFQLIETSLEDIEKGTEQLLAKGNIEKIGMSSSVISYQPSGKPALKETAVILEHRTAIDRILKLLQDPERGVIHRKEDIDAVGHRVVHGGEKFSGSKIITPEVLKQIEDCIELAPLHNPHNVKGYQIAKQLLPDIPHCAVFDTAFHQSMPPKAYLYGLPYVIYQRHAIRRYGFHGTSHRYLTFRLHKLLDIDRNAVNAITVHLGNGCSIAAVKDGKSMDTSMGFTPLEGLIMGTRTGDLDPAVILHIMAKEELGLHEANTLMNKHSGLIGISGVSNDMREVVKAANEGNERARWALEVFCYRIQKYIASYMSVVGKNLHGIAFTGGIGENAVQVREMVVQGLEAFDIYLDPAKNNETVGGKEGLISTSNSRYGVYVIPTNEELVIARDTIRAVMGVF